MAIILVSARSQNASPLGSGGKPKKKFIDTLGYKFQQESFLSAGATVTVTKCSPLYSSQQGGTDGQEISIYEGVLAVKSLESISGGNSGAVATLDYNASITGHAGGGQGSAVALSKTINNIATVATAGDSVLLPLASTVVMGVKQVLNNGANSANVFPSTGDIIDSNAANASVAVTAGTYAIFFSDGVQWYTVGF